MHRADLGDVATHTLRPIRSFDDVEIEQAHGAVLAAEREFEMRLEVPVGDHVGQPDPTGVVEHGGKCPEIGFDGRDGDAGDDLERRAQVFEMRLGYAREPKDDVGGAVGELSESRFAAFQPRDELVGVTHKDPDDDRDNGDGDHDVEPSVGERQTVGERANDDCVNTTNPDNDERRARAAVEVRSPEHRPHVEHRSVADSVARRERERDEHYTERTEERESRLRERDPNAARAAANTSAITDGPADTGGPPGIALSTRPTNAAPA